MEILRFIKWQWGQIHRDTKQMAMVLLCVIMCPLYAWYIGFGFVGIILTLLGSLVCSVLSLILYEETLAAWRKYKKVKEREAEEIVRRLSGTNNPRTYQ
jgi:Na+/H+-translocating membrane pyrophosphatase